MMDSVLGFNGERLDPISDTTHLGNGYRAYNPLLMRFNCQDSMSPFGVGGINPYTYCAGDPVNRADPSGHMSQGKWVGMGVGLMAGIVLSVVTEGAALPVVLSLIGEASISAGAELVAEAVDGQRIDWGQVGVATGISVASTLGGCGLGMASKLKGTSNFPFGGVVMGGVATEREVLKRGSPVKIQKLLALDILTSNERKILNDFSFQTTPYYGFLYRGDIKPPEEVFKNGFKSKGLNGNWWSHIRDNKNSHFISFSKDETIAIEFVEKIARLKGLVEEGQIMPFGYIYEVENLDYAIDISRAANMKEVVGVGYIPGNRIKRVYGVNIDDATGDYIFCYENNPDYVTMNKPKNPDLING